MNEADTRSKKIDPKLHAEGWDESKIIREHPISQPKVEKIKHSKGKFADYLLCHNNKALAVVEAKRDELDVSEGVEQAKLYAEMLQIRFTYSTNGDKIWFIDMGVKDYNGKYIIPSTEGDVDRFHTPEELWKMTYPEDNTWRDKFYAIGFNRDGGRGPRYYQENAINRVVEAVANKQNRILLTMATGTGKTYTAFQICWKLFKTSWNVDEDSSRQPRILFIADRNILANQAKNDFDQFPEDAMERINPKALRKWDGVVPKSRHLYFTIFQTFMLTDDSGEPFYKQYPPNFFDFIIIDECHRGGANDESQWRELMEYFKGAYQLGMTATPLRKVNANTYKYFGYPVYSYSLKQGIADGYLTPFRVQVSESNIDTYEYDIDDDIESGEIDEEKTYTEQDFYNGNIEIRDRDEYRVKEFLGKMEDPDQKTIVFCATQRHAKIIRDMINKHKKRPDSNYCERVTADDGKAGEDTLKKFQNNDLMRPTILTTSQKLSTGVDARNVRNIVLLRPVNNMVEFKQIVGRGTRLFDGKFFFTIYDFVGASKNFQDAEWDGDPFCPTCGNYPCTCNAKKPKPVPGVCKVCGQDPCICESTPPGPPLPCQICGQLPCVCGGTTKYKKIVVKLGDVHKLELETEWTEKFQFGDRLVTAKELVEILFGQLPAFFNSSEDLRTQWENPKTRQELLSQLEREGFAEDKLEMIRRVVKVDGHDLEKCDLYDVLEYLAYSTTPIERAKRVEIVKKDYVLKQKIQNQQFLIMILDYYERNGFKELASENLKTFIDLKFHSMPDAVKYLNMKPAEIRQAYYELQHEIYSVKIDEQAPVVPYTFDLESKGRMVADEG